MGNDHRAADGLFPSSCEFSVRFPAAFPPLLKRTTRDNWKKRNSPGVGLKDILRILLPPVGTWLFLDLQFKSNNNEITKLPEM